MLGPSIVRSFGFDGSIRDALFNVWWFVVEPMVVHTLLLTCALFYSSAAVLTQKQKTFTFPLIRPSLLCPPNVRRKHRFCRITPAQLFSRGDVFLNHTQPALDDVLRCHGVPISGKIYLLVVTAPTSPSSKLSQELPYDTVSH